MLLLNLVLFVGLFIGAVFGLEYILPPFGRFYYTDVLDILTSFSSDISYKLNISYNTAFAIVVILLGILPLIITIFFNTAFTRKKKSYNRYRLK